MIVLYVSMFVTNFSVYLPNPHDAHGWGLRVHNLSVPGPYLVGEGAGRPRCDVTLINFSKETREHDPLVVARFTRDLELTIIEPDGKGMPGVGLPGHRSRFVVSGRLRGGEFSSVDFDFAAFGFGLTAFAQVGRHRVEASIKIDGKTVKAPPVEFEVIAVPPSAVLVSHPVPLEGHAATESARPVVQQVAVGRRALLIYRGPDGLVRLAELPGKCEMTVEGAYGDWGPLKITYADKNSPSGTTTLVVHSIGGTPWSQEDQESHDYKHNIAPAPRPKP